MRVKAVIMGSVAGLLSSCAGNDPVAQRPQSSERVFIYYFDELQAAASRANSNLPDELVKLRLKNPKVFKPCVPPEQQAADFPAPLVPIAMYAFNTLTSFLETEFASREKRRLAALSKSYTETRSDPQFPATWMTNRTRCLIIDRAIWTGSVYKSGAVYVFGLRPVDRAAFTLEPLSAVVDASSAAAGQSEQTVNANVSIAFQTVQPNPRLQRNEVSTLPSYSVSFDGLNLGEAGQKSNGQNRSPVLPVSAANSPTSIAIAITESHTSLASVKERIALEKANRAALYSALGETFKAVLSE